MTRNAMLLSLVLGASGLATGPAAAQFSDPELTISLLSEAADYQIDGSEVVFTGLQLTQGLLRIEADEGRASALNFNESVWQLSGNVVISIEGGMIRCEAANLQFTANELRVADISGEPATFELQRQGVEEPTYAEAETLRYELASNSIEFSGNAKIIEGGNQITSSLIVYNMAEQRIQASRSAEDGKVKMTFTPSESEDEEKEEEPVRDTP